MVTDALAERSVTTIVRDVLWVIRSPVLLNADKLKTPMMQHEVQWLDDAFFKQAEQRCAGSLSALMAADKQALVALAGWSPSTRRLGEYFEWLVAIWLAVDSRFNVLVHHVPLRTSGLTSGRTLGELDFIVRDLQRDVTVHLEVAVKFYIGTATGERLSDWYGTQQRDRLDLKYTHMQWKQLALSRQADAQTLLQKQGWHIDERWSLLKGRLYYPSGDCVQAPELVSPAHERGHYQWQSQGLHHLRKTHKWDWLSAYEDQPLKVSEYVQHGFDVYKNRYVFALPPPWFEELEQVQNDERDHFSPLYESAVYEIEYGEKTYILRTGEDNAGAYTSLPHCLVITACNPANARPSEQDNQQRNVSLKALLDEEGFSSLSALGRSEDGAHKEPSWAVLIHNADELERVCQLGEQFGQCALLEWTGSEARLCWL